MPIKVIVEFQAKPGVRGQLKKLLTDISATHGPQASVAAPFKATRIGHVS